MGQLPSKKQDPSHRRKRRSFPSRGQRGVDRTVASSRNPIDEVQVLHGHSDLVRHLLRLPGGHLASAGDDGVLAVWEHATGRRMARLRVADDAVRRRARDEHHHLRDKDDHHLLHDKDEHHRLLHDKDMDKDKDSCRIDSDIDNVQDGSGGDRSESQSGGDRNGGGKVEIKREGDARGENRGDFDNDDSIENGTKSQNDKNKEEEDVVVTRSDDDNNGCGCDGEESTQCHTITAIAAVPGTPYVAVGTAGRRVIVYDYVSGLTLSSERRHGGSVTSLAVVSSTTIVSGANDGTLGVWSLANATTNSKNDSNRNGNYYSSGNHQHASLFPGSTMADTHPSRPDSPATVSTTTWHDDDDDHHQQQQQQEQQEQQTRRKQRQRNQQNHSQVSGAVWVGGIQREEEENLHCMLALRRSSGVSLVTGSEGKFMYVYSLPKRAFAKRLVEHRESVRCLVTVSTSAFASGSLDGAIVVWAADSLTKLHSLNYHEVYHSKHCSPGYMYEITRLLMVDQRYLAAACGTGFVVFDARTGKMLLSRPDAHDSTVTDLLSLHHGRHLVTAAGDGAVKIWALDGSRANQTDSDADNGARMAEAIAAINFHSRPIVPPSASLMGVESPAADVDTFGGSNSQAGSGPTGTAGTSATAAAAAAAAAAISAASASAMAAGSGSGSGSGPNSPRSPRVSAAGSGSPKIAAARGAEDMFSMHHYHGGGSLFGRMRNPSLSLLAGPTGSSLLTTTAPPSATSLAALSMASSSKKNGRKKKAQGPATPELVATLAGHSGGVSALGALSDFEFASCGADGCVMIWRDGRLMDALRNRWALASLIKGNIVE